MVAAKAALAEKRFAEALQILTNIRARAPQTPGIDVLVAEAQRGVAPPPSPVPAQDDQAAMQGALKNWAAAYEAKDAARVRAALPSMSDEAVKRLAQAFQVIDRYGVAISACAIKPTGGQATATCQVARDIRYKDGRSQQNRVRLTFGLERRGTDWVIASVQE
jgi:ketosteroid isomerase-like protein